MADAVAAIQQAIDIVGKLRALSKKIEDADFKMFLADLSGELADAKLEVANLKVELAKMVDEKMELSRRLAERATEVPVLKDGAYAFEGQEGLFCTACFDANGKKIRVTAVSSHFRFAGKWKCPSCSAYMAGGQ